MNRRTVISKYRRRSSPFYNPTARMVYLSAFASIAVTVLLSALALWIGRRMGDKKEDQTRLF